MPMSTCRPSGPISATASGPGLTAGAYVQRESIDAPLLDGFGDFSATSLGLLAGYDAGAMAMTGFIADDDAIPTCPTTPTSPISAFRRGSSRPRRRWSAAC